MIGFRRMTLDSFLTGCGRNRGENNMAKATFGSISSGTMRPEDLIPDFASELEALAKDGAFAELIREANALEDYESDDADGILEELFDALNSYAPSYAYFGAHPGDGADYGFWLCENYQDLMREDDVLEVSDLADVPADYEGAVLLVNDHGNPSFGQVTGGKIEWEWELV